MAGTTIVLHGYSFSLKIIIMKKLVVLAIFILGVSFASQAQVSTDHKIKTDQTKEKAKPTTTVPEKVHNAIHPHNKKYSGVKAKAKKEK
jgi:hypothetical protein